MSLQNTSPLPQFLLMSEDQLIEQPSMLHLTHQVVPVRIEDTGLQVLVRFLAQEDLFALPVIDVDEKPIGLVDRRRHIEFFSQPYRREVLGQRGIVDLLNHKAYRNVKPIVVEHDCSIQEIAQILISAGVESMVTGFIVTSLGRYQGVANVHNLLEAITQQKQVELYHMAHYDSLTGIPNRVLLADRLNHAIHNAERNGLLVPLLLIDLDRFKRINDSFGHAAGDAVLCKVAERIQAVIRRNDTVARMGGDEFVVLMEEVKDPEEVTLLAERLLNCMLEPIQVSGHSLNVTISIGSAIYPNDGTLISPLLAKADAAMYDAKSAGRNLARKYSSTTKTYNPQGIPIENELRHAIEHNELVLHFQPQIDLTSQTFCGVEVLVRWLHPGRGLICPTQFITIAEESGLIGQLGNWVLRNALRQAQIWQSQGLLPLRMSVNISAVQFYEPSFPGYLAIQMAEMEINPNLIELELTESMLMKDVERAVKTMTEIKALGVSLAIDDFGTGYSSLGYLRRFPIDRLKIDQSFVRNMNNTPINESIARTIIALAENLSLDVIAEGIETLQELNVLQAIFCSEGQGYLFGKPMAADEIVAWFYDGKIGGTDSNYRQLPNAHGLSQASNHIDSLAV